MIYPEYPAGHPANRTPERGLLEPHPGREVPPGRDQPALRQCRLSGVVSQGREVREINCDTFRLLLLLLPGFLGLVGTVPKLQQPGKGIK